MIGFGFVTQLSYQVVQTESIYQDTESLSESITLKGEESLTQYCPDSESLGGETA